MTFENHAASAKSFISLVLECEQWDRARAMAHLREALEDWAVTSDFKPPGIA